MQWVWPECSISVAGNTGPGGVNPLLPPPGAAGHLWRAREAVQQGHYAQALALSRLAVLEAGDSEGVRRRGFALAVSLLRRVEPTDAASTLAFFEQQAAFGSPHRAWALRALTLAYASHERYEEALTNADALTAEGEDHATFGRTNRVLALASLGRYDEAEAALIEAEIAAPGDEEVAMTRRELVLRRGGIADAAARTTQGGGGGSTAAAQTTEPVTVLTLGAAYPNPANGHTTLPLKLSERAEVRVSVYDVLGRTVTVLREGILEPGTHPLSFNTEVLTAGVYFVRAAVQGETSQRVLTRRITVLR